MNPQLLDDFNITKQDKKQFRKFTHIATVFMKFVLYGLITGSIILLTALIRSWLR